MDQRFVVVTMLALFMLAVGCRPVPEVAGIEIPAGAPAVMDGSLTEEAWSGSYRAELTSGVELFLMHAEGYLYLGLRGAAMPAVNIYLDRGSEIAVLHSSAALGTATYEPLEGEWKRTREFSWSCRETSDSPRAQAARAEFLGAEGWLASNGNMGRPEETEYQVDFSSGMLRLAVVVIGPPNYDTPLAWPVDLADDCVNLEILRGSASNLAHYSPDQWATVVAAP